MSRYGRDETEIARDLVVALRHERYADVSTVEALQDLRARRLGRIGQ